MKFGPDPTGRKTYPDNTIMKLEDVLSKSPFDYMEFEVSIRARYNPLYRTALPDRESCDTQYKMVFGHYELLAMVSDKDKLKAFLPSLVRLYFQPDEWGEFLKLAEEIGRVPFSDTEKLYHENLNSALKDASSHINDILNG